MMKHGSSHALATVVCMVAGTALTDTIKQGVFQSQLTGRLLNLLWQQADKWNIDPDLALQVMTVAILGFAWGVAFKLTHTEQKVVK